MRWLKNILSIFQIKKKKLKVGITVSISMFRKFAPQKLEKRELQDKKNVKILEIASSKG